MARAHLLIYSIVPSLQNDISRLMQISMVFSSSLATTTLYKTIVLMAPRLGVVTDILDVVVVKAILGVSHHD